MKRVVISILIPLFFLAACGSGDSTFNGQNGMRPRLVVANWRISSALQG